MVMNNPYAQERAARVVRRLLRTGGLGDAAPPVPAAAGTEETEP
jgi:hypothetical protein